MPDYLIFTDLDGTLLGHDTYTYTENLELIRQLKRRYPIILCSSKTALEIKDLQKKLGLVDMPFVAENGAYICLILSISFRVRSGRQPLLKHYNDSVYSTI